MPGDDKKVNEFITPTGWVHLSLVFPYEGKPFLAAPTIQGAVLSPTRENFRAFRKQLVGMFPKRKRSEEVQARIDLINESLMLIPSDMDEERDIKVSPFADRDRLLLSGPIGLLASEMLGCGHYGLYEQRGIIHHDHKVTGHAYKRVWDFTSTAQDMHGIEVFDLNPCFGMSAKLPKF